MNRQEKLIYMFESGFSFFFFSSHSENAVALLIWAGEVGRELMNWKNSVGKEERTASGEHRGLRCILEVQRQSHARSDTLLRKSAEKEHGDGKLKEVKREKKNNRYSNLWELSNKASLNELEIVSFTEEHTQRWMEQPSLHCNNTARLQIIS